MGQLNGLKNHYLPRSGANQPELTSGHPGGRENKEIIDSMVEVAGERGDVSPNRCYLRQLIDQVVGRFRKVLI